MRTKVKLQLRDIIHNKYILMGVGVIIGVLFGLVLVGTPFKASIMENLTPTVTEQEIQDFFIEHPVIKDLSISPLSKTEFLIEFMGTEGTGDSLHPYSYILTKKGGKFVNVKEVEEEGEKSFPRVQNNDMNV